MTHDGMIKNITLTIKHTHQQMTQQNYKLYTNFK
jgi:hypothetical protein